MKNPPPRLSALIQGCSEMVTMHASQTWRQRGLGAPSMAQSKVVADAIIEATATGIIAWMMNSATWSPKEIKEAREWARQFARAFVTETPTPTNQSHD